MANKVDLSQELINCKEQFTEAQISKHANEVLMFMLRKYQFYAEVIMQARIVSELNLPGTAAMIVDKAQAIFMFGPLFMTTKYSFANRMADAIHEVEHFMRLHASRGKGKQKRIWNVACDIVINQLILDMAPDPWSIFPVTYKLEEGLTEEQYYKLLLKVQKEQEREGKGSCKDIPSKNDTGSVQGKPSGGGGTDSKGRPWLPKEDIHPHWERINEQSSSSMQQAVAADMVNRAINACKGRGTLPGHIEELANWLNEPAKVNWRQELKQIVGNALKGSYAHTWSRLNRRSVPMIRGKHRKHGKKVVFAIDTSGSMSTHVLEEAINELRHMRKLKEADIWLVMCDTEVAWKGKIERFTNLPKKFYGRGGTAFEPVFEWVEKENIQPNVLIYLTDGAGSYPKQQPLEYTTIWLMTEGSDPDVDWGRVIHYPDTIDEL